MNKYPKKISIYEHGILSQDLDLKPLKLIATTALPIYAHFNLAIVDHNGKSLNERAVQLANINGPHWMDDYFAEYDLRYCVLSSLYHLNRLIDYYVENTELFKKNHPVEKFIRGNLHDPRIFYEIDSFLMTIRRVYDAIPKIIWKHYHPGRGDGWGSIVTMIKKMEEKPETAKVPKPFDVIVKDSWDRVGVNLRDYRDCMIHYVPLTNGLETCWLEKYNGLWGANVKLPASGSKSRKSFDFENGPEALHYCHNVAIEIVDLCEKLKNQTKLGEYLNNPKPMS